MHFSRKRQILRTIKFLVAASVISMLAWLTMVSELGKRGSSWVDEDPRNEDQVSYSTYKEVSMSTMKTIVAYSEGKQMEMNRPAPVYCKEPPKIPPIFNVEYTWRPDRDYSLDTLPWQTVPDTDVTLYSAYYDDRTPGQPFVRILAMFGDRTWKNRSPLYCQTRLLNATDSSVEVVTARPLEIWWHEWDKTSSTVRTPLLLSCSLSCELTEDAIISIVKEPCDEPKNSYVVKSKNTSTVTIESSYKLYPRNFTICVKDMYFMKDISNRLIEWIEMVRILGAEMIDIYITQINDNITHILDYYNKKGFIRLFRSPVRKNNEVLWQRRRDHLISYNDCLYRNIRESRYIIPIDVDEIILPKIARNFGELIERLSLAGFSENDNSSILIRNMFFFERFKTVVNKVVRNNHITNKSYVKRDDVRITEMNLLDNYGIEVSENSSVVEDFGKTLCEEVSLSLVSQTMRSSRVSPAGDFSKSLMVTRRVLTAFNHYPLVTLRGGAFEYDNWVAPIEEVQLNHYRGTCDESLIPDCSRYLAEGSLDEYALRFSDALTRAVSQARCDIGR